VTFRLRHSGPLVFTLAEVAPVCRRLASFHARGERGVNRIRFQARVGNRTVEPGTYELVARRPGGGIVLVRKLVIVRGGTPTARQLATARKANTCVSTGSQAVSEAGSTVTGGAPAAGGGKTSESGGTSRVAAPPSSPRATPSGGVLGEHMTLSPNPKKLPFLVLALVGLAILLLALGALPRSAIPVGAAGALVARRRLELASAGVAVLVASLIAYLIA
jgi:hypothetical protein